jgi:hypothetical protein
MLANHPYQRIPPNRRFALFTLSLLLTVILTGVLQYVDGPLKTVVAPYGIVSYEFAGRVATAQRILDSWGDAARVHAGFSLGLDFLYMPAYASTIGLACAWLGAALAPKRPRAHTLGVALAWGLMLAAGFDACENLSLTAMLLNGVRAPWPAIAFGCAVAKFALLGGGLAYALVGAALWVRTRRSAPQG